MVVAPRGSWWPQEDGGDPKSIPVAVGGSWDSAGVPGRSRGRAPRPRARPHPRPRPAVFAQPIVSKAKPELLRSHFIPTMEKLKKRAGKVVAEEEQLRMEAKAEAEDSELLIRDEFSVLCRDLYALYPLLIRYVDNSR